MPRAFALVSVFCGATCPGKIRRLQPETVGGKIKGPNAQNRSALLRLSKMLLRGRGCFPERVAPARTHLDRTGSGFCIESAPSCHRVEEYKALQGDVHSPVEHRFQSSDHRERCCLGL